MGKAYLSKLAKPPLIEYLKEQGYDLFFVGNQRPGHPRFESNVDPRINTHADIYMCQLGVWEEAGLYMGDADELGAEYPADAIFNCVCTKDFFIHNLEHTNHDLADAAMIWRENLAFQSGERHGQTVAVNVKQAYTRCNLLPIDNSSFITSDAGIAKALEPTEADVLLIRPGHVLLPGYPYGFLPGTAGCIFTKAKEKVVLFNGDLSAHPDSKAILSFIQKRNIYPVWFRGYPLEDIGSILAVE